MTPELTLLFWSAVLTFVQMLVAVSGATLQVGLPILAGNRDKLPEITGWAGRAQRAHRNMLESLVLFAVLVLLVHVLQKANATSALGVQLFFWGRVAYAAIYIVGVPWVRTGVWFVSVIGMVLVASRLL